MARGNGGGRAWTAEQARAVLRAWARSGQSGAAFARERGLVPQRLFWWRRRLDAAPSAEGPTGPKLVPLCVREPVAAAPSAAVVVTTRDGARIEVAEANAATAAWVATVLARTGRS